MFFSEFLRKPRPHLTPYPPAYPLILTPHLPPFPYLPILPFFGGSFPPCFFSLFSTHPFTLLPLPRAGVQVSYVHRSAPPVAFLCTSLSDKGQFRPFSERLVHNITTAGTFSCTSQTCTSGADRRRPPTWPLLLPINRPFALLPLTPRRCTSLVCTPLCSSCCVSLYKSQR